MRLRHEIKQANTGILITELDRAVRGDQGSGEDVSAVDMLLEMALTRCELFHDKEGEAYASLTNNGHRETWLILGKGFSEWLSHELYKEHGKAPREQVLKDALNTLIGRAKFDSPERAVAIRVGKHDGAYYIDLCNDAWQAVEIMSTGWQIIDNPPIRFVRTSTMRPLPTPQIGGDVSKLWELVNIAKEDRLILLTWILECYRCDTPYPILEQTGEQGTAKSTNQRVLKEVIDPNRVNLRAAPKCVEDIFIAARNSHLVSYENLSHLSAAYQDALCVLATGGGFATRTLFTNAEETAIDILRPTILNGISVVVTAQDLLDRTLHLDLQEIKVRLKSTEIDQRLEAEKAGIFGGILDLFVKVLAILPSINIDPLDLPRMADLATLGEAVYRGYGLPAGTFLKFYKQKRIDAVCRTIETSPVALAAMKWLETRPHGFEGTVKQLRDALTEYKPEGEFWPRSPKGFADALRRIAPALRLIGINARIADKAGMHGYACVLKKLPKEEGGADEGGYELHEHDEHDPSMLDSQKRYTHLSEEVQAGDWREF